MPGSRLFLAAAMGSILAASIAHGAERALQIVDAWVPASDKVGGDVPLLMTVRNDGEAPDALLRARCPVANFSERHTVDRGEGGTAMRNVASIPLPAGGTTTLKADGYHVMLLQTRQPLVADDRFTCSLAFQKAGNIETEVTVRKLP
jgi:periplasmic copper chaperone A